MIEYKKLRLYKKPSCDDYILRYRDERRFMAYCRSAVGMEIRWSCPPLMILEDYLSGFRNLLIVCTRITPVVLDAGCGGGKS